MWSDVEEFSFVKDVVGKKLHVRTLNKLKMQLSVTFSL